MTKQVVHHSLPLPFRCISWFLIVAQVWMPLGIELHAAAPVAPASEVRPELPHISKTERRITQRPSLIPTFSESPTTLEIFRAGVLAEPLVPVGGDPTPEENKALSIALLSFLKRSSNDDVSALIQFLEKYPESSWNASLLLNLGKIYRKTGYFSKALDVWERSWKLSKMITDGRGRTVADASIGELIELNARLGRLEALKQLYPEISGREFSGPATEQIARAKDGLWMMENEPGIAFPCGPLALYRVRVAQGETNSYPAEIQKKESTKRGTSLSEVKQLADQTKMKMQMAWRNPGAAVVLPCVVHWTVGHYAAVVEENAGRFLVQDPTFTDDMVVSALALDAEASGYYLIPEGTLLPGWRAVDKKEAGTVWGKGFGGLGNADNIRPCDEKVKPCDPNEGMAGYNVHALTVNLNITDTPLRYDPPVGPPIEITVTYNHREASQPGIFDYVSVGPKFTLSVISYIENDPSNLSAPVKLYVRGGGRETYSGYSGSTSNFVAQRDSGAVLRRMSSTNFVRTLPDGTREIFDLPKGSVNQKVFLTSIIDPAGNAVTYEYDLFYRLTRILDALGQATDLEYDTMAGSDPRFYYVSKITDPFGRSCNFTYDIFNQLNLSKITDVLGITSKFKYGTNDFIRSLTTPYGTTKFTVTDTNTARTIEITDPLGGKERVYFEGNGSASSSAVPDADTNAPAGAFGGWQSHRNTLYWDKKAMQDAPGVYTSARIFHWLHAPGSLTSPILESEKLPLESRVYYEHTGQGTANDTGISVALSNKVRRKLADGTTQTNAFLYNSVGKVTQYTDPVGRVTTYTYDTNLVDLLEVRQVVGATNELLVKSIYNSQHLPLFTINAAGQTNAFGYNPRGQLTAVTNARGETVSLSYDLHGFLTNVTGSLPGATTSFTYDYFWRMRTLTDSEGYTVTYDYDTFNRLTKVTYPDGTFEQIVYLLLDPILMRDRRGTWTQKNYDILRRVTSVKDGAGRVTQFDWCGCGSLESLTDPMGRVTRWVRDVQGRVTAKLFPDLTQRQFIYETNSSRLWKVVDAKNQTNIISYYADDNLKQVSYTNTAVATPTFTYTYDTNYNRLLTMTDGIGTTTYGYYAISNNTDLGAGQLGSVDGPWTNDTITYQYDNLGRITNRAIDGVGVNATFDALGRVTQMTNVLGAFTNEYVGVTPRVSSVSYPNGQTVSLDYLGNVDDQRLQTIWNKDGNGDTISKFDYTYDAEGQIQTWTQQGGYVSTNVYSFEYDRVDQLLGATLKNASTLAMVKKFIYGYDAAGNRTSEQVDLSVSSSAYNGLNQLTDQVGTGGAVRFDGYLSEPGTVQVAGSNARMTTTTNFIGQANLTNGLNNVSVNATDPSNNSTSQVFQITITNNAVARTLTYDANGNLTNAVTVTTTNKYEWDAVNRLIAIYQLAGTNTISSHFEYDGLSRRVGITEKSGGVTTSDKRFLWCGMELCEERDPTGATVTKRFFGHGEQIGGYSFYFSKDHLGSIREMTDNTGAVRARYDYDPYGRTVKVSGDLDADFGFTGHYYHYVSGLYLTLYRAYDPNIGRWLSRDPISEQGGVNLYGYVMNDPINYFDLYGLFAGDAMVVSSWTSSGAAIGGILGAIGGAAAGGATGPGAIAASPALSSVGAAVGASVGAAVGNWIGNLLTHNSQNNNNNSENKSNQTCRRVYNPKHHPNSDSPEPSNVEELWKKAVLDKNGSRYAQDSKGAIHRFSPECNGTSHWNGSTATRRGLDPNQMPSRETINALKANTAH